VVELAGLTAAMLAAVSQQPGVLSVRRDGDRVVIRAEPAAADLVLRQALTGQDKVHVIRVGADQGDGGEEPRGEVPGRAGRQVDQGEPEPGGVAKS